jgi:hypothetical protein
VNVPIRKASVIVGVPGQVQHTGGRGRRRLAGISARNPSVRWSLR